MVGANDQNLLWGMAFTRQIFMLKIFMMLVYQTLKLTYMRRRRRQERWYQESVNRIRRYSRWRSRRQQRMFQSLISELSRPKTVVRSVWSRQRSGSWWDVIVEGGFEEDDWTSNFRMSQRTFAIFCNQSSRNLLEYRPFPCTRI